MSCNSVISLHIFGRSFVILLCRYCLSRANRTILDSVRVIYCYISIKIINIIKQLYNLFGNLHSIVIQISLVIQLLSMISLFMYSYFSFFQLLIFIPHIASILSSHSQLFLYYQIFISFVLPGLF